MQGFQAAVFAGAGHNDLNNALGPGRLDHGITIMIERFVGQVTANINQFHGAGLYPYRSPTWSVQARSEEHTSELQSRCQIVCRRLLEEKSESPYTVVLAVE